MKKFVLIMICVLITGCTKVIVLKYFQNDVMNISMYGINNERTFYIDKKVKPELNLLWNSSTYGSYSNTSFSLIDSLLLVPDLGGRITSFNIETGKKIGELKYSGEIEQAVVVTNTNLVFIVNESKKKYSTLVIYNLSKGKERKTVRLKGKFNNELIYLKGCIIAISDFGIVYKISESGKIEWQVSLDNNIYSNPAADEENIYIASIDGVLFSLRFDDGIINYRQKIAKGFQSGITLSGNSLFLGDNNGNFFSVNKFGGEILWKFNSNFKIVSTPGLDNENVYFGNLNGDLFSLNKQTGKLIWVSNLGGLINTSPLIFRNLIIQPNLQKRLNIIDKKNGNILEEIEFDGRCKTTPIYFENKVFFGVDKGEVFCYSFIK